MRYTKIIGLIILLCLPAAVSPAAKPDAPGPQQAAVGQTPPRLSLVDGRVSFWRPGAEDWTQAQVNTPLAPGDVLYTGSPGNLELQIGSRAFVRAWANTRLGLESQEPDFLQFKVTAGYASFDLRTLAPGRTVQVDTPNATFTIDHPGYYRIDATDEYTSFIARRGGQAVVTPTGGGLLAISPGEEVIIEGMVSPVVTAYTAPKLDEWDKWNYARTDQLLEAVSAHYVSPGIYGAGELDAYGTWRIDSVYGPVWFPTALPPGWVPYSSGSWIQDSFYGWTWLGIEPWGWAPYHYGRWVFVNGFWGWAPGPVVARPVYAPALVAFFGGPGVAAGIAVSGGPVVSWVALGWGEPLVPWWGPQGFIHRPWWGGWGGPHIVNNVVIKKTTVVKVQNIRVYRNVAVHKALVSAGKSHFGRGRIESARTVKGNAKKFRPILSAPRVRTTRAAFGSDTGRNIRPPEKSLKRPTAAAHPSSAFADQAPAKKAAIRQPKVSKTVRPVRAAQRQEALAARQRPAVALTNVKRPADGRAHRSVPSKIEKKKRTAGLLNTGPAADRLKRDQSRSQTQAAAPSTTVRESKARRPEDQRLPKRRLAVEPAKSFSSYWPGRGSVKR
jgi:hypothetical protein